MKSGRCLLSMVLLGAWALLLVADAIGAAVRDIGGALSAGLIFALVLLFGCVPVGLVVLVEERRRQDAQMAALAWELERVRTAWEAAQARQRSQVVAERKALDEQTIQGIWHEIRGDHEQAA